MPDTTIPLQKAARLALLNTWEQAGYLEGLSLAKIANLFPVQFRVTRAAIGKDIRSLTRYRQLIAEMEEGNVLKTAKS